MQMQHLQHGMRVGAFLWHLKTLHNFAQYVFVCRKPFTKPDGWLVWAILGTLAAPIVVGATASLVTLVGYEVGFRQRFLNILMTECHLQTKVP